MTARFAVVGQPIAHSRSPQIHAAFAAAHGIAMTYERIEVAADALPGWVARFLADGGQGANVTLPHKQAAAALCATLGERARRAGAVNTLVRMEGDVGAHWHGDNTDGVGLVRDLTERTRFALKDARVLLLGAGGAARGVAPALLDAGIAALVVANRTPAAAVALCDALHDARVSPCALQDAGRHGAFDLVVNATAAGHMADAVAWPVGTIGPGTACVDLSYGPAAAPFLRHARVHGAAACVDGLGMLVEQAAESFFLWHGVRPATQPVYAALRETLQPA